MNKPRLCDVDYDDFLIQMEEFHGYRSPGMLIGALMLDRGLKRLGPTHYLNVVSETVVCLPDAIQLLTPCTFGNGFLQVLDWGKFALTAYERQTLAGVRVWLDNDKIGRYPLIRGWFERTGQPREKPPFDRLAAEILSGADALIVCTAVQLVKPLKDLRPVPTGRCPECGESYPLRHGPVCPACGGSAYYEIMQDVNPI
jgi:formylmethanofuran dehydrogenase subunit E